jgi:hypothetical protein
MKNKKETVEAYMACHKEGVWYVDPMPHYETVFANMVGGVYGECRPAFEDGKFGLYEIEISGSETESGNPTLFLFRDYDWVNEKEAA